MMRKYPYLLQFLASFMQVAMEFLCDSCEIMMLALGLFDILHVLISPYTFQHFSCLLT